ncbi:MAG: hypothetical protein U1E33_08440 [Rhodospirillales bacterium]
MISYAQNFEDVLLFRCFGKLPDGFYVDIGAFDPVVDSVTKAFYDQGWSGINVEHSPSIEDLRRDRPRDINLAIAISDAEGRPISGNTRAAPEPRRFAPTLRPGSPKWQESASGTACRR